MHYFTPPKLTFGSRMRSTKTTRPTTPLPAKPSGSFSLQLLLWGVFAVNTLFYLPPCLDRSLAPRFLFLSLVLLAGLLLLWNRLRKKGDFRLHTFDLLLLVWYGLNVASVGWAFSWSEAVFYTQKVLLLFVVYWLVRQSLAFDEPTVRQTLQQATTLLTYAMCGILAAQLAMAALEHGIDNQNLYDLDWFLFGNKSLTAEFLFFLLVFNVLFFHSQSLGDRVWKFWVPVGLLLTLILLLQTRTAYFATAMAALLYISGRAYFEPSFVVVFRKKILPAGLIMFGLLAGLLAFKGQGNSLTERLNPLTYLESATANERRFVWYKTDLLNADHFWLGVGNGSWKFWFPSKNIQGGYRLQEQNVVFTRAHNDYLEVRSEMGIVGVVLFCTLFGAVFLAAIRALLLQGTDAPARREILALMAGILGYCIVQYFDFPRERIEMQVVLAILFAWLAHHSRVLWASLPGVFIGRFSTLFLGAITAGLMFNLAVGWNRVKGEIHNARMFQAQSRRDYQAMIAESKAAKNRFYEYTDVAIPLDWHEGVAHYQLNQIGKSLEAFERAYRLNPWSFQVINNYASALVQNQQYREAIPHYEKALEINPRYEDGKFNLAYAAYHVGNYPKALEWLHRVDTIKNPKTDEQRNQNDALRKRIDTFRQTIEQQMK